MERVTFKLLIFFLWSNLVIAQNQMSVRVDMRSSLRFCIFEPMTGDSLVARGSFAVAVKDLPKNRGIVPHYNIEPTIAGLPADRDTVKEYTLNMITRLSDK